MCPTDALYVGPRHRGVYFRHFPVTVSRIWSFSLFSLSQRSGVKPYSHFVYNLMQHRNSRVQSSIMLRRNAILNFSLLLSIVICSTSLWDSQLCMQVHLGSPPLISLYWRSYIASLDIRAKGVDPSVMMCRLCVLWNALKDLYLCRAS